MSPETFARCERVFRDALLLIKETNDQINQLRRRLEKREIMQGIPYVRGESPEEREARNESRQAAIARALLESEKRTKYFYLRLGHSSTDTGRGAPIGCVASKKIVVDGTSYIVYATSVVNDPSPTARLDGVQKDAFDKQLARKIAEGRLRPAAGLRSESPHYRYVQIVPEVVDSHAKVIALILHDVLENPSSPTRAKKAASRWLSLREKVSLSVAV